MYYVDVAVKNQRFQCASRPLLTRIPPPLGPIPASGPGVLAYSSGLSAPVTIGPLRPPRIALSPASFTPQCGLSELLRGKVSAMTVLLLAGSGLSAAHGVLYLAQTSAQFT